jgi:hypothetical protein
MSETPSVPEPELMSAVRARNLSRHYKGLAYRKRRPARRTSTTSASAYRRAGRD